MDPYGFQYRSKAHLIAIADIILSSISFAWSLLFMLAAFAISELASEVNKAVVKEIQEGDDEEAKIKLKNQGGEISTAFVVWIWLMALLLFSISIAEIVAAVKLLNATQPGKEPAKALKWSKFWRALNGAFFVIIIFNLLFCSSGRGFLACIFVLINIGIRGAALFYVHKFVKELEGYTQCGATLPTEGAGMYQSAGGEDGGYGGKGPASYEY